MEHRTEKVPGELEVVICTRVLSRSTRPRSTGDHVSSYLHSLILAEREAEEQAERERQKKREERARSMAQRTKLSFFAPDDDAAEDADEGTGAETSTGPSRADSRAEAPKEPTDGKAGDASAEAQGVKGGSGAGGGKTMSLGERLKLAQQALRRTEESASGADWSVPLSLPSSNLAPTWAPCRRFSRFPSSSSHLGSLPAFLSLSLILFPPGLPAGAPLAFPSSAPHHAACRAASQGQMRIARPGRTLGRG